MGTDTDTKWMTYQELGEALGIEAASAKRLAIRRRWPKRPGNDGRARVGVPVENIQERAPGDVTSGRAGDGAGAAAARLEVKAGDALSDNTGAVTAAVTALASHIKRLEAEIEALKQERTDALARAADRDAVAAQVAGLQAVLQVEKQRVLELQFNRDGLQADRDRWAAQAERLAGRLGAAETKSSRSWWAPWRRSA